MTPKAIAAASSVGFGLSLLCGIGTILCPPKHANAQEPVWEQLRAADSRLVASQIAWKKVTKTSPNPNVNLDEYRTKSLDIAKQRNLNATETEAYVQKAMSTAQSVATGSSSSVTINIWHRGQTTRADVLDAKGTCYGINFSDGRNFVTVDSRLTGVTTDFPTSGLLTRDVSQSIQYSIARFGDMIWLAGGAVTDEFTSKDAKWSYSGDTVVLEQKFPSRQNKGVFFMARLKMSKKTLRPSEMDVFLIEPNRLRWFLRYTPSGFKVYPGGVEFPSSLKVEAFDGGGVDGSGVDGRGRINFTEEYQVVRAAFNEKADLSDLKVPPGTQLGDIRFGREASVSYTIDPKGILPSDDKVLAMLKAQGRSIPTAAEKKAANDKAVAKATDERQAPPSGSGPRSAGALVLSVLFVLSGLALWTRSKRE